ncbi:MAG: UDP-N-acetylmuramoyl-tripeptide--D-alanyl-D-alanine ligase [Eggerthellaceae bacterium]|nr:UDP-N-acetylmuramoyl-tripeptide--D-alanyl-D-alanine ligase [Eggerthellaceae bacterium]
MKLNAKQIAHFCGGTFVVEPIDSAELAHGITWDSRDVKPGDVYVAIPGERVDGHSFVAAAIRAGAVCALIMSPLDEATLTFAREMGAAIIEVPNTSAAVVDLARGWRPYIKGRVVGVTGSVGKTTTKNFIRDVLASRYSVVATRGNQNNELGAPRTILNVDPTTEYAVVEMGMQELGEIAFLCGFVRPDWGVISCVGESHIEFLGSRENIARAKSELFAALPGGGMAFVNAADDFAGFVCKNAQLERRHVRVSAFDGSGTCEDPEALAPLTGIEADGHVAAWATDVTLNDEGCPRFILHVLRPGLVEEVPCELVLRGLHNVSNACAAAAVGAAAGIDAETIARALAASVPEAGRQEIIRARAGWTIVNDAYNASPESMRASLMTFAASACKGKRYAVLGDMGELGDFAIPGHESVGRLLATLPIDFTICIGELASHIADAAIAAGANPEAVVKVQAISEVLGELDIRLAPDDSVLVKASHFMGLTRVVEGLRA